jgi:hypothetical protein
MTIMYKLLKALTPLVLAIFLSGAIAAPMTTQVTNEYHVISSTQVSKGGSFELTVDSARGVLDQKDVAIILPTGFRFVTYSPVFAPDGSLLYRIQAGLTEGDYVIYVQINSPEKPITLSQKINVQQTVFEKAQPFLIAVGLVAILFLITGGTIGGSK